jgi:hypothetical protein
VTFASGTCDVPDYLEPARGWRVWRVVEHDGDLALASVLYPTLWPVRAAFLASCRVNDGRYHDVPAVRCGCGVHAAASVADALSFFDGRGHDSMCELYRVIGRVSLWGRVIEGQRGWRASHAYPGALYVPARSLAGPTGLSAGETALALTRYGVPVELLDDRTKQHVRGSLEAATAA